MFLERIQNNVGLTGTIFKMLNFSLKQKLFSGFIGVALNCHLLRHCKRIIIKETYYFWESVRTCFDSFLVFFRGRAIRVVIQAALSNEFKRNSVVPQGSVPYSTLFFIFSSFYKRIVFSWLELQLVLSTSPKLNIRDKRR